MKPASTDSTELLRRVRQQLILAQVRIMELEDLRDELTPKVTEAARMQQAAQLLADEKTDLARHLERVVADNQRQLAAAEERTGQLQREIDSATRLNHTQQTELQGLADKLAAATVRLNELAAEIGALKASRSWRWSAWLRALGL